MATSKLLGRLRVALVLGVLSSLALTSVGLAQTAGQPAQRSRTTPGQTPSDSGGQPRTLTTVPYVEPASPVQTSAVGWTTVTEETFEGTWPSGNWSTRDNDIPPFANGDFCWGAVSFQAYQGTRSAWPAAGCTNALNPAVSLYPNLADSWMVYGPFSLSDANAAFVDLKVWAQVQPGDQLAVAVSTDNGEFRGVNRTGLTTRSEPPTTDGWLDMIVDLGAVPNRGSVLGQSQVWVAVIFRSDFFGSDNGPFVDNFRIEKRTTATSSIGGRNLQLRTDGTSATLTWLDGTVETGYLVIRWSPVQGISFLPSAAAPLAATATTFTDAGPLTDSAYCYLVMPIGGTPPNPTNALGFSDFLCLFTSTISGQAAGSFTLDLRQTDVAGLSWTAASGGLTNYEMRITKPAGGNPTNVILDPGTVRYQGHTDRQPTCYQLATVNGSTTTGTTARLCAIPLISSLTGGPDLSATLERAAASAH